ncbi:extracellular calcium-sensing receptor-like [Polypterus senegalus]|uniref:extracellular calcium-sensing receptor-like n=1 Tax=Polypterus senegalus TaxID=55291 RepID=UPI00196523EA|nr:extracellular calcium-sensing receptor-like [Polypterus senegalus]
MFALAIFSASAINNSVCKIQEKFQLNGLYKNGDFIIGGIFEISFKINIPELSFRYKPKQWTCESFEFSVFQWAMTMIFAIEEINRDQILLPNITLGYRLYDNCVKLPVAMRVAAALISGKEDEIKDYDCRGPPPVIAIIGDPVSTHSIAISRILSLFQMPMVSYSASCSCLSNKNEYPSFFRTIPSDTFQVKAMIEIIKHYGWTWLGAIASDDDYGQNAIKTLSEEVKNFGCLSFLETIHKVNEKGDVARITRIIKESTANVIIVFTSEVELKALMTEVVSQNITGKQWIASEGWSTATTLATKENFYSFGGTLGIAIRRGEIPGLEEFLCQIRPNYDPDNNLAIQFWETLFQCKFEENAVKSNLTTGLHDYNTCTGAENVTGMNTAYNTASDLRYSYNVYKAVYAVAHALHALVFCDSGKGPFENNACADIANIQPWQLLYYLKKVNFTNHLGERVAFDENGDALAIYDIVNWQLDNNGRVIIKNVGVFDKSAAKVTDLLLKENDIYWNLDSKLIPVSVCSQNCPAGTRKAPRKGQPLCCFDCIPCAEGEISSETDSIECLKCPIDFWSNQGRTECILKEIEFLSFEDAMGMTLTTIAVCGACLSVAVLAVFIHFRSSPVVKANNSELSFLLLISLTLCFLCSLCFIGQPSHLTCKAMHMVFGISFAMCISCILVKTIVVIMAFKATLPGNNMMKWFGALQQRCTVFLFTFIQLITCIIWLTTSPPYPSKNTRYQNGKIIFECDVGSLIGFSCLLGYIGLLAGICFILAFLARNLPDTFNEAKFITFSMLIFCAVWITFIPAYVSSPGKFTVAVEVFAILASSFGILFAIFSPKCYIILLKPEKNTKKALMGRVPPKK